MSALVDWGLAARIARAAAGDGPAAMDGGLDLGAAANRSQAAVIAYTGLQPAGPVPEAEWVSRREWAQINLDSMRGMIEPLEERVEDTLPPGLPGRAMAGLTGRVLAVQLGGLLGLASRRVLGQYELPLLGGERVPRLIFVGENLDAATGHLGATAADVLEWVALHEMTHAVHFTAVPWLAPHLGGLARSLLEETPLQISTADLLAAARRLGSTDPRRLLEQLAATDPVTLLAPPQSRPTIESLQGTMALVEGFAEHVMDAAAGELGPRVESLRAGLDRRRESRGTLARVLAWLLGLEMKLRQYRDGKRFVDAVVATEGIAGLDAAWSAPDELPSLAEIGDPEAWVERTRATAAA